MLSACPALRSVLRLSQYICVYIPKYARAGVKENRNRNRNRKNRTRDGSDKMSLQRDHTLIRGWRGCAFVEAWH